MANTGFGSGGFSPGAFDMNDFDALARQYWGAWGEQLRAAAPAGSGGAPATAPGWNEAVAWWSQFARGGGSQANEALDRFNGQARGWFGQMQQLAAQFAGQGGSPVQISQAWKQMIGDHAFADVFSSMQGPGQSGFEQWFKQVSPMLQMWQQGSAGLPAFGFAREHQERWQTLAKAQADYQQNNQAYQALMAEALQKAFGRFEDKLAEREEPGRQIGSARALFDLWIDAAEEVYAEIALSQRFRSTYGEYVNAQMRLRGAVQTEVEQLGGLVGMPGRTEVDAAHRKIVQLERELRKLRDAVQAMGRAPAATAPKQTPPPRAAVAEVAEVAAGVAKATPNAVMSKPNKSKPAVAAPAAARKPVTRSAAAKPAPARAATARTSTAAPAKKKRSRREETP